MKLQELTILLPCHSLEDFPVHHEGDEAEGLLAAWSALWHPVLMADAGKMPGWARADDPPDELGGRLLVIPQVSESLLLAGWPARAADQGACVIRKLQDRDEIAAAALAALDDGFPQLPEEVVQEFYALGFAYLQEELLTRQMRYMSNLDEVHFETQTLEAARAALAGEAEKTRTHLQNCYDVLTESRERFYPAESYLLDLTLVAPTTLGASLRGQLASGLPTNLLLSGETLDALAEREPESLAALRAALEAGTVALVGGEYAERELPLLSLEAIQSELERGAESYRKHLGRCPEIYGRRRAGLTPLLPQLLARMGFTAALHMTLDEGRFPRDDQSKSRWEGVDASGIDALTRVPLDIDRPETFLALCERIGETMDLDHVATVVLAHWPGKTTRWYDDLRRFSRFAPVLGKFVTLEEFFKQTESAGAISKFGVDQYRTPYLKQAIIRRQPNPLSRFVAEHRRRTSIENEAALDTLAALLKGRTAESPRDALRQVESAAPEAAVDEAFDREIGQRLQAAARRMAESLPRKGDAAPGYLLLNPHSFARRVGVELPELSSPPDVVDHVKSAQAGDGGPVRAVVELPAMGYARVAAGTGAAAGGKGRKAKDVPLADAEELMLRNEYFDVTVDRHTGAIRALHDYRHRGNRFSQQLAYRQAGPRAKPGDVWSDPDEEAIYSVMAADSVEVTSTGPALGEIVSRGRLLTKEGKRLAGFRQRMQLWRGTQVLLLDIELDVDEEPRADPWNSYYAARFAWSDSAADLYRGVGTTTQPTDAQRLESPYFVEARTEKARSLILTGGLPYHRRVGTRMLDTMLVVRGETARKFRLGIGIDVAQPMQAAVELLSPVVAVPEDAPPPGGAPASWLFHMDARNVLATHWSTLPGEDGRAAGFRCRWLETEGRAIRARLRSFRPPKSARQVDFAGQTLAELTVEDDCVLVDFAAYEWVDLEVQW